MTTSIDKLQTRIRSGLLYSLATLFGLLISVSAFSAESLERWYGKKITSIEIAGLKRIEKDAILAKMSSKAGETLEKEKIRKDIQALFNMGYFEEVEARGETDGGNLKVKWVIKERPVISKIRFDGNERITSDDLKDVIKVKEWSILDSNKIKEDVGNIQKHYEDKGYYLAKVNFEVKYNKSDEVELIYRIADYEKVMIKKITFLNNRRFSDDQLRSIFMETKEGSMFSFLSSSGNFKESAFRNDLQRLTYWYLDNGYLKFRYENPVVTVSDDKKYLYISVYVDEGDVYGIKNVDFSGDLLFTKEELHEDTTLRSSDTFSITKRNQDIQKLTERYQDLGYAFVNVIPKIGFHEEEKLVDIDYSFEKGNLAYFGEFIMVGNSKTWDKVVRRELRIKEGELFSGSKLRESKENVERLGYFQPGEVIFNQVTPKGKPNIVNIEISVKERSTGTVTLGAGYGSVQKFFFTTQVSEINFLGRGQTISLMAQVAADRLSKSLNLGFTDPYAFDTHWSAGFDFYYITAPIPGKYLTRKLGMDTRFGRPIFDYTNAYITYKNEGLKIEDPDSSIDRADIDADEGVLSSIVYSVVRDRRNNLFETTAGNYQSVSLETAGIGGDKKFLKWNANSRFYTRLVGDLVFRTSWQYSHIEDIYGQPIPPSEKFYLGGPNNLKGYEIFSVGPARNRVTSAGREVREPLGGRVELYSLFELEYPLIREAGLKWVVFYDAGNAFDEFPNADTFKLRTDAGFGLRWFSPIGPLRFEWGFPFNRQPNESDSVFQFFIGPPF